MSLEIKTKEIIKHFGFKFNKNLGQNFLIDETILQNTVDALELTEKSCVIEIGPGIGTLTHEIAKGCREIHSIEIDRELIPILEETLGNHNNIHLINDDALKVDFKKLIEENNLDDVKIAANLPYYVTTPMITKIFNSDLNIKTIVLMIQKEAADRIMAEPDTREYGFISVISQYYSSIKRVCGVSPSSFIPQPKIESIVIRMDIEKPKYGVMDEKLFFRIVKDSFNMRRKTIKNALKQLGISEDKIKDALEASNIDAKRRGETLSISEFAELSNEIKKRM